MLSDVVHDIRREDFWLELYVSMRGQSYAGNWVTV
jgi:hypothetical protein